MAPSLVHLPNGQTLSVSPVFGGLYFKSNDLAAHHNVFPPGWTIILNIEDDDDDHDHDHDHDHERWPSEASAASADMDPTPRAEAPIHKKPHVHRFRRPSLRNDHLFISSISNPASNEFRPPTSPTRQIAMMLWATLYWYFHQQEPARHLTTAVSAQTPDEGKPRGEWKININREGIFKGKHLLPKLERMGLVASDDSSVGLDPENGVGNVSEGWTNMFVSRRSFWQMDPRIYLFTLTPLQTNSPFPSISPAGSRPNSPNRSSRIHIEDGPGTLGVTTPTQAALVHRSSTPPGPFHSSSHLPTYYPPPPAQYTFTNNVRHPLRPKPPRQGETFYIRYIPSLEQYLTFRVASLSKRPITYSGPFSTHSPPEGSLVHGREILRHHNSNSDSNVPTLHSLAGFNDALQQQHETTRMTDLELLHKWMNEPRVAAAWGEDGPQSRQEEFLKAGLTSKHSIPVIGCFDGKPFGYFEIYWTKEDRIYTHLSSDCGDWDRGLHVLVGEQEFRGPHRFRVWMNALVHYCWIADSRTNVVLMEPRVDNVKIKQYCEDVGFCKEKEITFPHKQSNLLKIRREAWEAPSI